TPTTLSSCRLQSASGASRRQRWCETVRTPSGRTVRGANIRCLDIGLLRLSNDTPPERAHCIVATTTAPLNIGSMRSGMAAPATARAAERAGAEVVEELGARLATVAASHGESRIKQDIEFHGLIAAGSGNQTLASMLAGINSHTLHARVWHATLDADANRRA